MKAPLAAHPVLTNPFPHTRDEDYGLYFANTHSYPVPCTGWNTSRRYQFWLIDVLPLQTSVRVGHQEIVRPSQSVALFAPNLDCQEFLKKGMWSVAWLMFRANNHQSPLRKLVGREGFRFFEDPGLLIQTLIGQICSCFLNPVPGADWFIQGAFYQILSLLRSAQGKPMRRIRPPSPQPRSGEKPLRNQVENHLRSHPGDRITVVEMARRLGLGLSSFAHRYHRETGETFVRTKNRIQIEEARSRLLQGRDLSIKQVALELGFSNAPHFSRVFHRVVGMSPAHFTKEFAPRFSHHTSHKPTGQKKTEACPPRTKRNRR